MSFARTYAKVSLAVAALIALHGVLALKFDHAVDNFTMVLSIVTLLWLIVSGLAVLFFPEKRTPIWAPLTFIGYVFLNLVLSVLMVLSFGRDEANTVLSKLNHHREPIYYGQMVFAGFFALLNVFLLFRRSTEEPTTDVSLQTIPSAEVDKELMPAPPQAIEQTTATEPSKLPSESNGLTSACEQSTLNFSPETTESVIISVAVKEVVEVVVTKTQEIGAPIEVPAPPEIELNETAEEKPERREVSEPATEVKAEEPEAKTEAKAEEPEAKTEAKTEEPEAKAEEPEAKTEEPEAKTEEPEAKTEEPEAKVEEPEAKAEEPEAKEERAPEAPKEPAYEGTWDI